VTRDTSFRNLLYKDEENLRLNLLIRPAVLPHFGKLLDAASG